MILTRLFGALAYWCDWWRRRRAVWSLEPAES